MPDADPINPYQPSTIETSHGPAADSLDLNPEGNVPLPPRFWTYVLLGSFLTFLSGFLVLITFPMAIAIFFGGVRTAMLYRAYNLQRRMPPPAYSLLLRSSLVLFGIVIACLILMTIVCIGTWEGIHSNSSRPFWIGLAAALVAFGVMFALFVQMGLPKRFSRPGQP